MHVQRASFLQSIDVYGALMSVHKQVQRLRLHLLTTETGVSILVSHTLAVVGVVSPFLHSKHIGVSVCLLTLHCSFYISDTKWISVACAVNEAALSLESARRRPKTDQGCFV